MAVLQLNEFFVEGSDPLKSHVLLNITEPSTPEESRKGYFFAVCEIMNGDSKFISKTQEMIDEIENSYYELPDETDKTSLEIILDKINEQPILFLKKDIEFNCVVGAMRGSEIIFSFYGRPQMLLLYKGREGAYGKMDLIEENRTEPEENERPQLFSQIVQGKINANDYLFVSTDKVADYFNHDRLQKIITTRPPRQSAEHLQRVLAELKNDLSFGGIIIRQQNGDEDRAPKTTPAKKGSSAKSLGSLFSTEQNTARILSPSIFPRLRDKLATPSRMEAEDKTKNDADETPTGGGARILSAHSRQRPMKAAREGFDYNRALMTAAHAIGAFFRLLASGLLWIVKLILAILAGAGKGAAMLFIVAINYQNRRAAILSHWSKQWRNYKEFIRQMPLATKALIIASVLVVVALIGSALYIKMNQKKESLARTFRDTVETIKGKTTSAESYLIYNDTAAAISELNGASDTLGRLDCAKNNETTCKELGAEIENLLAKARKAFVATPELLADWGQTGGATKIFTINQKVYGFGSSTSSLSVYDPLTKQSSLVPNNLPLNGFTAVGVPKENDFAALSYQGNNLASFKPADNSWQNIDVDYPRDNAQIAGLTIYNRRLYSLDSANGQIYKHESIKTGFSRGKDWLTDGATRDFKEGVDIAIDGDVFVLRKNGAIDKFTAGKQQSFSVTGLDPALTSADKIWTYTDLNYLYVLDGAQKRIVILDKTGLLVRQILAPELAGASGMIADEASMSAYFISGNRLYKISLK